MFEKNIFLNNIKTFKLGKNIYIYNEVMSTNDILLEGDFLYGDVVVANKQLKGRGRSGRIWIDDENSLIFSICLNGIANNILMPFNIIAGYAVCSGISCYTPAKLKWPNDCTINGKKVSGMLLEASFTGNNLSKIVFGAGINVNQQEFPEEISYRASSIAKHTNTCISKEILLTNILYEMEVMLEKYGNGTLKIEELWHKYSAYYNRRITIHINDEKKEMIEKGILNTGELIVEDIENGNIKYINAGEIGYDFNS